MKKKGSKEKTVRYDSEDQILHRGESQRSSDGMYVYTYYDEYTGKRKYLYSSTLEGLRKKIEALKGGIPKDDSLNAQVKYYMDHKVNLKDSTRMSYLSNYNRYIKDSPLGKKKYHEITYSELTSFYTYLLTQRGLQMGTVENINNLLNPVFKRLIRDGKLVINPCEEIMKDLKKSFRYERILKNALTEDEQRAFMHFVKNNEKHKRWFPILQVLLGTGLRIGECAGLRWIDIDLEKRTVNVDHQVNYFAREEDDFHHMFHVQTPKSKSGVRMVPMFGSVYDAFIEEKEFQESCHVAKTQTIDGMSDFIFTDCNGKVYRSCTVNRAIRRICKEYNEMELEKAEAECRKPLLIPDFTCHILRHTFCSRMVEANIPLKMLQEIMGHANVKVSLDDYARFSDQKKLEVINNLPKDQFAI